MSDVILRVTDVHRVHGSGATAVHALAGVSLEVRSGDVQVERCRPHVGADEVDRTGAASDDADQGRVRQESGHGRRTLEPHRPA